MYAEILTALYWSIFVIEVSSDPCFQLVLSEHQNVTAILQYPMAYLSAKDHKDHLPTTTIRTLSNFPQSITSIIQ